MKPFIAYIKSLFRKKHEDKKPFYIVLVDDRIMIDNNITFTSCENMVKGYFFNFDEPTY
jgi:hypothetical protein